MLSGIGWEAFFGALDHLFVHLLTVELWFLVLPLVARGLSLFFLLRC